MKKLLSIIILWLLVFPFSIKSLEKANVDITKMNVYELQQALKECIENTIFIPHDVSVNQNALKEAREKDIEYKKNSN